MIEIEVITNKFFVIETNLLISMNMNAKDVYIKLLQFQIKMDKIKYGTFDLDEMAKLYDNLLKKNNIENRFGYKLDLYDVKTFISFSNMQICYICEEGYPKVRCKTCGCYVHSKCISQRRKRQRQRQLDNFICSRCY